MTGAIKRPARLKVEFMTQITFARVRELLHYDPETGNLIWKIRTSPRIKIGDIAGCLKNNGYVEIKADTRLYKAHRLVFLWNHGHWPENDIDHIDGVRHHNQIENLRDVNDQENQRNQRLYFNNSSGFCGVHWNKRDRKWYAQIRLNGIQKHLGYFDNIRDAIARRKAANIEYGFHQNHGLGGKA